VLIDKTKTVRMEERGCKKEENKSLIFFLSLIKSQMMENSYRQG